MKNCVLKYSLQGQFFYYNDTQEADIEWLSAANSLSNAGTRKLWLTNQDANGDGDSTYNAITPPANPTTTEHEYRLDVSKLFQVVILALGVLAKLSEASVSFPMENPPDVDFCPRRASTLGAHIARQTHVDTYNCSGHPVVLLGTSTPLRCGPPRLMSRVCPALGCSTIGRMAMRAGVLDRQRRRLIS